jgi:Leucine-rich repeat (LRR) protein
LGKEVSFVQLYLDHNLLESLPVDGDGYFCGYDDAETISVTHNRLKKVPNMFSAKSIYTIKSVDFSANDIDGFEGEADGSYRGIRVETFTLASNPKMAKYPKCLAKSNSLVAYIILRGCGITEIPKGSFEYDNSASLMSLDLSYNRLSDLPFEMHAGNLPYLYGVELSYNSFKIFPLEPLDAATLTILSLRAQRDAAGKRCLQDWPDGIGNHTGLRALYLGSNDLRVIDDSISTLIYYLDISDNPNIVFDASDICYAWSVGAYILIYDRSQNILNCNAMLQ